MMMKKHLLPLPLLAVVLFAAACQKPQNEAERNAEVERRAQERLAAERQAQKEQELTQREAALKAREKALAKRGRSPLPVVPATAAPATPPSQPGVAQTEPATYTIFYRRLDPYGDWLETSNYGYVFQPRVALQNRDWRPYTVGHWVYTDAGWTWISEEKFGWATYHYGRWIRLRGIGWVWVPGRQWAPAWVSWRRGDNYVGWAPLPPEADFDRLSGIQNWADNYYDIGPQQYNFVSANEFGAQLSPRQIVPPQQNVTIINQTTNVTNITYQNSIVINHGPSYDELRARSRQPIERFRLERSRDLNNDQPAIRGEVVTLPAVDFNQPEKNARPSRVARRVDQVTPERGWSGIADEQTAQKARAKMRGEATPPPNLPRRSSVTPSPNEPVVARLGSTPAASPMPAVVPSATPTPPGRRGRAETQKEKREQREQKRAARQAEREKRMLEKRGRSQQPDLTPTPRPSPSPTPSPSATETPSPSATWKPKLLPTPNESATASATESPSPTPRRGANPDRLEHRGKPGGAMTTPPGGRP